MNREQLTNWCVDMAWEIGYTDDKDYYRGKLKEMTDNELNKEADFLDYLLDK